MWRCSATELLLERNAKKIGLGYCVKFVVGDKGHCQRVSSWRKQHFQDGVITEDSTVNE